MSQLPSNKIDVVTTAIRRPEILAITYESFFTRIINLPETRIILNIDPLGNGSSSECVAIAKQYGDDVVVRTPLEPNFSSAINWCWGQLQSPYFIHIEDDWLLKREINFEVWLKHLQSERLDQSVLLMKRPRNVGNIRYSFRPHLGVSNSVKAILPIPEEMNPEKYVSSSQPELASADFLAGGNHLVSDTGRKWAKARGLRKSSSSKQWFSPRSIHWWASTEYQAYRYLWKLHILKSQILRFFQ